MIIIEENAQRIINKLNINNFKAYIVGGSVRDSVLSNNPDDWDIATNATPDEVIDIFSDFKIVPTGLKHGTITIVIDKKNYEVTTFRTEGEYKDNRKPEKVFFTNNLEEDLSRRDFTINALAYNDQDGLLDYYKGLDDLKNKIIRTVGSPKERFKEDALRMLRAIRFACKLNFEIEKDTFEAIICEKNLINNISKERIRDELSKILLSDYPARGISLLEKTGIIHYIIPEIVPSIGFEQRNPHHDKTVFDHTLKVIEGTPSKLNIRLAALLHDIGKPDTFTLDDQGIGHFYKHSLKSEKLAENFLKRLKFDNKLIKNVTTLVREHMSIFLKVTDKGVKRLINRVGRENIDDLFSLQMADIKGTKPPYDMDLILNVKKCAERIINKKEPLNVKDLKINGNDLIELGIKPGKEIGKILNNLLQKVLENPELNTKENLISLIRK